MKLLRVLLVGALLAAGPLAAPARAEQPVFRSWTEGSALPQVYGNWDGGSQDHRVFLDFAGGHVLGGRTHAEAWWVSPWTTEGEPPTFAMTYSLDGVNFMGRTFTLDMRYRYQERGRKWSKWRLHSSEPIDEGDFQFVGGEVGMESTGDEQMRFEWHMKLLLEEPVVISGNVRLIVS